MSHSYLCKAGNNAERQLCASTDFIALILNVLRIKERLQNDYICLNISNVTDSDSLASHTTTNQEYIGRVQTLVWYFHFCFHNDFVLSTSRLTQRYFKPWKQVARNHHTAISSTQQVSRHDEGSIRPPLIVAYRPLSFPVKCGWIYVTEHLILLPSIGVQLLLKEFNLPEFVTNEFRKIILVGTFIRLICWYPKEI